MSEALRKRRAEGYEVCDAVVTLRRVLAKSARLGPPGSASPRSAPLLVLPPHDPLTLGSCGDPVGGTPALLGPSVRLFRSAS